MNYFDAIILGSGQAGNPLALKLAKRGLRVAMFERNQVGGTCVNTGCTPTKTMVMRAQIAHYVRNSSKWAIESSLQKVDLSKIVAQKNAVVHEWRAGVQKSLDDERNVTLVRESAKFVGELTVEAGGKAYSAEKVFINTGAEPGVPPIPGLQTVPYLTNETILDLTEIPGHLIVLGGGYIGLEFAQMFRRFGSRVSVVQNGSQIASPEDPEIATSLQKSLEAEGLVFEIGRTAQSVLSNNEGIEVLLDDGRFMTGTHLLIAAGRTPRTADLDLGAAGVATNEHGAVRVDEYLQTSAENVWAMGDVKGGPAFTHISYDDHLVVYQNAYEDAKRSIANRIVPYCLFTDPQLGGVGISEREARGKGLAIKVGSVPMTRVARAVERDEADGLMKIVVDAKTDQILGARILGIEGGEVIQILSTVMVAKLPYTFLNEFIFIHPTLAEGLFALVHSVQ